MFKKALSRGLLGIPIGVFISTTILLSISLIQGENAVAVPSLVEQTGSILKAVTIQYLLSCLCGFGYGATSIIWEMESWSPLRRMAIGFSLYTLFTLPIAYFCHWMEHTPAGFMLYLGIFVVVFFIIWGIQYCIWKNCVKKITKLMQDANQK